MRRRRAARWSWIPVGLAVAVLGGGCTGSSANYAPTIDPARFTDRVTNRYFPLTPGTTFVYDGLEGGAPRHEEVTVTGESATLLGVRCVVVHDTVTTNNGQPLEATTDYYAQDTDGNVWYFGEDTAEFRNGQVASTGGSWRAGVGGALPGILMKGTPVVGDSYRQEYLAGQAEDMGKILRVDPSARVPAGEYRDVLVTEDTSRLEPLTAEHKSYAPGIGLISAQTVRGGNEHTQLSAVRP